MSSAGRGLGAFLRRAIQTVRTGNTRGRDTYYASNYYIWHQPLWYLGGPAIVQEGGAAVREPYTATRKQG